MQIWVDADACPKVVKEILFRAAERARVTVTLVANQALTVPRSPFIRILQVESGFDMADKAIVERAQAGDLVITADIPLAAELLPAGVNVLSPRGEPFSEQTIGAMLTLRDFMDTLRSSGIQTGGPSAFSQSDRQAFANQLDRFLRCNGGRLG